MSMNAEPEFSLAYGGMLAARSRLRIAVPAFRLAGFRHQPQPQPRESLSRDELLALFRGELSPAQTVRLTEAEVREKDMAHSIRRALYPDE